MSYKGGRPPRFRNGVVRYGRNNIYCGLASLDHIEISMNLIFLKRREGGPKGRPSEASLKFFLSSGLILVYIWSTKNGQKTETNLRQ